MKEMRDEMIKNETEEKPHAVMNEDAVTEEKPHTVINEDDVTEEEFLAAYRPGDYEKPSVAVDMAIFSAADKKEENYRKLPEKELRLLMIRRGGHPFKGHWALPGGFVEPDENTESAAARELMEETGVDNIYLEQLYTFSDPHRDPRTWVMSCSYLALVDSSKINVEAGDDAEEGSADDDPDEKLVDAFDALVDSWMEPRDAGVSLADSDAFVAAFRKLPEERREECLQRALNLVPDDNVMLLAGILMDKSIDQELVELVFNDVLNRDEEVKKPILQEIFKDKSHPCWADTAWILDVTDDLPK